MAADLQSILARAGRAAAGARLYQSGDRPAALQPEQRPILLQHYFQVCEPEKDYATYEKNFYLFVLIRRLRSLGSYGYLGIEKSKPGFFESIAPTLAELNHLFASQAALAPFKQLSALLLKIQSQWPRVEQRQKGQ